MPKKNFHKQATQPTLTTKDEKPADELPEKIDSYDVERFLGKGGMSLLYLGRHQETLRPVVLKTLAKKHLSNSFAVSSFEQEVEILQTLDHPNISKMIEHGEWDGGKYIALEYVEGFSVRELLQKGSLSVKRAIELTLALADAVKHLHTNGVIHRDLKPENLILTHTGDLKLLDFGIAIKKDRRQDIKERGCPQIIGTPVYMSPEQKKDPDGVTELSDLYSLAIIAYELVVGRLSMGVLHLSLIPKGLQRILSKALQQDPNKRYSNVSSFIADLRGYLDSPQLSKDLRGIDHVRQLVDEFRHTQREFLPRAPALIGKLDVGLVYHPGILTNPLTCDILQLPEGTYGIVIARPIEKKEGQSFDAAHLRGLFRGLAPLTADPVRLITLINEFLVQDPREQTFVASYVVLNPNANEMHFITSGQGSLWLVPAGARNASQIRSSNPILGANTESTYLAAKKRWNEGDRIVIDSEEIFAETETKKRKMLELDEESFQTTMMDYLHTSPQDLAEALARDITRDKNATHPMIVMSIERKE